MEEFVGILLKSNAILTLISGLVGLVLSLLMLLNPESLIRINAGLNRRIDVDMALARLNFPLRIDPLIYRFPFIFGILFCTGGLFCLVFLLFGAKASFLSGVFSAIFVDFLMLLGRVSGVLGVIIGLLLIIAPQRLFTAQRRMDFWVDTDKMIKHLDETTFNVDAVCLRYPIIFGLVGSVASITLLVLAVVNLLPMF